MPQLAKPKRAIAFGLNPKLASALTDPLRERILVELDNRTLSPSQFTHEAGADINRVSRCFRQLEKCGYAEVVEERPGSRRGKSIEHVYRRTANRLSDSWIWGGTPRAGRTLTPSLEFRAYLTQIVEAIEADTFDQEIDRHISWDIRALDETARRRLLQRMGRVFAWLGELEGDTTRRGRKATREVIPTTVGLFAIRSPQSPQEVLHRRRLPMLVRGKRDPFQLSPEIANAMANRWRARILLELLVKPLSPSQFVQRAGGDPSYVARCFRELADWGLIELIETRTGGRRRGAVERVYRNAHSLYFGMDTWPTVPRVLRVEMSNFLLTGYVDRLEEATDAKILDAEPERDLLWRPAVFDRAAWRQATVEMDRILEWIPQLERESVARAGSKRGHLIPTVLGLACFRSPPL